MSQEDCENAICVSTQYSQIQRNFLVDLQESPERFCIVLPVFGFKSAKNNLTLIKSY